MARRCLVSDCERPHAAKGYCGNHYYSWKQYGDPLIRKYAPRGEPERFLRKALKHQGAACLIWPYAASHGYAVAIVDGVEVRGNRWICEQAHGPAPSDEHEAAHNCGNETCISPHHLRWATHVENVADRALHGTQYRGEDCTWAKITDAEVQAIRDAAGKVYQRDLAAHYGITQAHVSNIQIGKRRADVRHAKGAPIDLPGAEVYEEEVLR